MCAAKNFAFAIGSNHAKTHHITFEPAHAQRDVGCPARPVFMGAQPALGRGLARKPDGPVPLRPRCDHNFGARQAP